MKKKTSVIIGLGIGASILATTIIANAVTPNGYDTLKNAVRPILTTGYQYDNYTIKSSASISVDGELEKMEKIDQIDYDFFHSIVTSTDKDGKTSIDETDLTGVEDFFQTGLKIGENQLEFMESCFDVVMGDTKNNIVYSGKDAENYDYYTVTLTGEQIPDILKTGVDAIFSEMTVNNILNTEEADADYNKIASAAIDMVTGQFHVTDDGKLAGMDGQVGLTAMDHNGETHYIQAQVEFNITDIGTTVIESKNK